MVAMMWIYLVVVTLVLLPGAYGDSIEPLAPLAATEKSSVNITCKATVTDRPEYEGVRMKKLYADDSFDNLCKFLPPDFEASNILDPNKYSVTKLGKTSFNFTIKDVAFEDAKKYRCGLILNDEITQVTTLVVLRTPTLILMEKLKAGQKTEMSCDVQFEVPADFYNTPKAPAFPKITATIAGRPISGEVTQTAGNLMMKWETTLVEEDDQKEIVCKAYTDSPKYEVTHTKVLSVLFDVRNIQIAPIAEIYHVGDEINCTAEGNPRPDIKWVPVVSKTLVNVGPLLQIVNAMWGDPQEEWRCIASNRVSGMDIREVKQTISFSVARATAPPGGGTGEQKAAPTTAIAAGVAVPLILIVAVVIVVVIVFKKKKKNSSFKPKDPEPEVKSPFTDIDTVDFGPHNVDSTTQPLKPAPSTRQPKPNASGHNVSFSEDATLNTSAAPLLKENGNPNTSKDIDQQQGASTEINEKPDVVAETGKPRLADLATQGTSAHGEMPIEQYDVPHQRAPVTATEFPDIAAAHPGLQHAYSKPKPKPLPRKQPPDTMV